MALNMAALVGAKSHGDAWIDTSGMEPTPRIRTNTTHLQPVFLGVPEMAFAVDVPGEEPCVPCCAAL